MRIDKVDSNPYQNFDILSFTGTQVGLKEQQKEALKFLLEKIKPKVLIHGDCIGADSEAHDIASELSIELWIRPCTIRHKRAFKQGKILAEPTDPLLRNILMVEESKGLIACPKSFSQELRSGTWATIRVSERQEIPRWIVYPDGKVWFSLEASL